MDFPFFKFQELATVEQRPDNFKAACGPLKKHLTKHRWMYDYVRSPGSEAAESNRIRPPRAAPRISAERTRRANKLTICFNFSYFPPSR